MGNTSPVRYHYGEFPPKGIDWPRLVPFIGPASMALARYDGLLLAIPNPHILLSPLTTQEAVLSSKIEGTHVTITEVLEVEAGAESPTITRPRRDDAEEVLNYRKAMQSCVGEMEHRPLSQQVLRAAHEMLMQGVRGRDHSPGKYRHTQNWIGPRWDCPIEDASFIPIAPEQLQSGMDAWESYIGLQGELDSLVQLAIAHVEFEALHPFEDGNGRLGRMLIPLYLYQSKLLSSPDFYMSGYLDANHEEYQERLRAVSRDGDWTGWCAFFLEGVRQQATENARRAQKILNLYDRVKTQVADITHSQHAIRAVDWIFQMPVFRGPTFATHAGIPKPTAGRILTLMRRAGLLRTLVEGKGRKANVYAFGEVLNIAEGTEIF